MSEKSPDKCYREIECVIKTHVKTAVRGLSDEGRTILYNALVNLLAECFNIEQERYAGSARGTKRNYPIGQQDQKYNEG